MLALVEKNIENVDSNCMCLDQIIIDSSDRPLQSKADICNQDNFSFIVISSVKVKKKKIQMELQPQFELQAVLYRSFCDDEIMWQVFLSISDQTVLRNYIIKQLLSCAHVKIRLKIVLGHKNNFRGVHRKGGIVLLHNEDVVVGRSSSYI